MFASSRWLTRESVQSRPMREVYGELVRIAASVARTRHEARDLVQSVLLDALERGITDFGAPERRAWLRGALRRRAAFTARTAGRARRRDGQWFDATVARVAAERSRAPWRFSRELLERLPASLRTIAVLASAELQPQEIRSVLRLTDTAFRKRLSMLRRTVREASLAGVAVVTTASDAFALGDRRAALIAALRRQPGWAVATHDPDGHPLILSIAGAHKTPPAGNSC
jgi:DNA-directed RNA polymerase specialized sigma24 family protein